MSDKKKHEAKTASAKTDSAREPATPNQPAEPADGNPETLLSLESVEEVEEALRKLIRERNEYLDHLQRMKAEFDNYKKRVQREKEDLVKFGCATLIEQILEVVDNLERALGSAHESGEINGPLGQGVEMTVTMLFGILERQGLKAIPSLGQPFDPEVHNAVSTEPRDNVEANTILMEWQKGYWLGERVLRPAKVVVATGGQGT